MRADLPRSAPAPRAARRPTVAVLRALMLGDLLCATPALRALRHAMPDAHIVLVGLPWARELVQRLDSVDEFVELPGWPGLPERAAAAEPVRAGFVRAMQARAIDLALQMHGSGGVTNALIASWRPSRQAGFGAPADATAADHFVPWPHAGSEVERLLRLTDRLGLPRRGLQLDFPLRADDLLQARALRAAGRHDRGAHAAGPYVVVHPGSQWPSRRWPVDRFAQVADALAAQGLQIVLTGTAAERQLTADVAAAMRRPATRLAGATTLWTLGALVAEAQLVLCNDTGISHVAAALRTPSVVVASGSDVSRWAPLDALRHRVLWQQLPCRPCAHVVCPVQQACAAAVGTATVRKAALDALEARRRDAEAEAEADAVAGTDDRDA